MKYKTAFRLAIRGMGVWIALEGALLILKSGATHVLQMFFSQLAAVPIPIQWWVAVSTLIAGGMQAAVGAYLFFRPDRIANLAIPSDRPYCPQCGYEISWLGARNTCPECGASFQSTASVERTNSA